MSKSSRERLLRELRRMAYGRANDAAKLAFLDTEDALAQIDALDLSALAGIHRLSNGTVELKFVDRIKLLELLMAAEEAEAATDGAAGFVQALDRAAERLHREGEETDEDDLS